jgi:hypothetical protein
MVILPFSRAENDMDFAWLPDLCNTDRGDVPDLY